jgi:hypothetical protein
MESSSNNEARENQSDGDFDIFLYDSRKIIHITTAGMPFINSLEGLSSATITDNFRRVLSYRRVYKYEITEDIQRENLATLEDYTAFFELMAKRGFYSYDRVNIDDTEDYRFQLIAQPIYHKTIHLENGTVTLGNLNSPNISDYKIAAMKTVADFPEDSGYFDIREYI